MADLLALANSISSSYKNIKAYSLEQAKQFIQLQKDFAAHVAAQPTPVPTTSTPPVGTVYLHASKYNTPTNGTTNAAPAIKAAIADVPLGGTLLWGPYRYLTDPIDLSARPDINMVGYGGSRCVDKEFGTRLVPATHSMKIFECKPTVLSQYGPSFTGFSLLNPSGLPGVCGFSFEGVNCWSIVRCGGKYLTDAWLRVAVGPTGTPGQDSAWNCLSDFWTYQCTLGIDLVSVLNFNATMGNIDVGSSIGIRGRNQAQNVHFTHLSFDGSNQAGVGKGIGFDIQDTGAHDWHVSHFKAEALEWFARIRGPQTGSTTKALNFALGSIQGVQEGSLPEDGGGFDIGLRVELTDIARTVHFQTMPSNKRVVDANPAGYPYTFWEKYT